MIRVILLLTVFNFMANITANARMISEIKEVLGKALNLGKIEQCDFGILDEIEKDLKDLWAVLMKGREYISSELDAAQKFLKKIIGFYNICFETRLHIDFEIQWEIYMKVFGKEYSGKEKEMRRKIFKKSNEEWKKHNELYKNGSVSYSTNLNYFSDWTDKELNEVNGFRQTNVTVNGRPRRNAEFVGGVISRYYYHNSSIEVPASFDWRTNNFVTPVKNQGSCGSCYAITGNGALEAYHKKRTGELVVLSTQNILDCTWHLGNNGCESGDHVTVFKYAEAVGVVSNSRYPYTMNASHNCRWRYEDVVATNRGYYIVEHGNELALMQAVANHGTVAVAIGINRLMGYRSGVFYIENCGPVQHTALVVGYGTDPKQGDYWIVRNCWGYWWGENGYVRMARNRNNMCRIASHAYFPF